MSSDVPLLPLSYVLNRSHANGGLARVTPRWRSFVLVAPARPQREACPAPADPREVTEGRQCRAGEDYGGPFPAINISPPEESVCQIAHSALPKSANRLRKANSVRSCLERVPSGDGQSPETHRLHARPRLGGPFPIILWTQGQLPDQYEKCICVRAPAARRQV